MELVDKSMSLKLVKLVIIHQFYLFIKHRVLGMNFEKFSVYWARAII